MYWKAYGGLLVWNSWLYSAEVSLWAWHSLYPLLHFITLFHILYFQFNYVERILPLLFFIVHFVEFSKLILLNWDCVLCCDKGWKSAWIMRPILSHSEWTCVVYSPFKAHSSAFSHCTYPRLFLLYLCSMSFWWLSTSEMYPFSTDLTACGSLKM